MNKVVGIIMCIRKELILSGLISDRYL